MLEMRRTGPGSATLLSDGKEVGRAQWETASLTWGRERVQVARVTKLESEADCRPDFWAYLTFLFQRDGAAAATLEGAFFWFSQALQASWQEAGSPTAFF